MRSILSLFTVLLFVAMNLAATADDAAQQWGDAPKVAPFQAVRWRDQVPEVRVNGTWYELVALNDLPAGQIITFAQSADTDNWHKRIEEDLPAVLILMGHKPGSMVKLSLKDLATGNMQTLERVPMTKENRRAIVEAKTSNSNADPAKLWRDGPKLLPFQAVRWRNDVPEVLVNATWYELVSLNDLPADKIVTFAQSVDADHWQKRFEEDLPALLIIMKHEPGPTVTLKLKDLASGNVQVMEKVPMTAENRAAIWKAASPATTQPGTTGL
jgi:hypothetical protein